MSDEPGGAEGFPTPPAAPPPPPNMAPPPGYVSYGGANQGAYGSFQRIGSLAKALTVLLVLIIPVQLVGLFQSFTERDRAKDFLAGRIDEDQFKDDIAKTGALGLLALAVLIAIGVLTMIWMFRIAKNLQQMNRVATWKPGWAVAGWFVPPLILYVVPFLMFRDLWKGSDPDATSQSWRAGKVAPIVNVWWILYGVVPVLFLSVTLSSFSVDRSTESQADELVDRFGLSIVSNIAQVLAAAAFLLLVRQLSARHRALTSEA